MGTMSRALAGCLGAVIPWRALTLGNEDELRSDIPSPEPREQRAEYGLFTVPPRSQNNGMLRLKQDVDPPCSDCVITAMSANLEYPDGSTADARDGMWMHHIVFSNKGRLDQVCGGLKPGQRFWGAGNERSPLDLTNGG